MADLDFAAIVLAGGAARRMGGRDKPAERVGGRRMRDRVLAAVEGADPRIVVGPADDLPPGVRATTEDPPGGGPVAAAAAGLSLVPAGVPLVALLAADLPMLTPEAVGRLRAHAAAADDGAIFVDDTGRRQLLCGVWRTDALRGAVAALGRVDGAAVRALVAHLRPVDVAWAGAGPPPWFDCDTDDDLDRARRWEARG
jgi:molybdopterin-guanine dinucleotide biosynthesis protein A